MRTLIALLSFTICAGTTLVGCAPGDAGSVTGDDTGDEMDFTTDELKTPFDRDLIITDEYFNDTETVDVALLQALFEKTPYHTRSFLADYEVGGRPVAELFKEVADARGMNPLVLVARGQAEASLLGRTTRPSSTRLDRAFGCGCYDGQACFSQYRGFEKQIECAADVLINKYEASENDTGLWRKGHARATVDHVIVTPKSHATAATYAYTPLVSEGTGGSWLSWNINQRYINYIATLAR